MNSTAEAPIGQRAERLFDGILFFSKDGSVNYKVYGPPDDALIQRIADKFSDDPDYTANPFVNAPLES